MRISDFDVLIVPRLGGADSGDWPSRWLANLSTARLVAPPGVGVAERKAWTGAIADAVGAAEAAGAVRRPRPRRGGDRERRVHARGADVRGAFLVAPPIPAGLERVVGPGWPLPRAPLPWPAVGGGEPQRPQRRL